MAGFAKYLPFKLTPFPCQVPADEGKPFKIINPVSAQATISEPASAIWGGLTVSINESIL